MHVVEDEKLIDMNNWCVFQYLKDIKCRRINKTWVQTWIEASTEPSQASRGIASLAFVVVFLTGNGVCPEVNPPQLSNITRILWGIRTGDGNTDGCLWECWGKTTRALTERCWIRFFSSNFALTISCRSFHAIENAVRHVIHWLQLEKNNNHKRSLVTPVCW